MPDFLASLMGLEEARSREEREMVRNLGLGRRKIENGGVWCPLFL